MTMMMADWNGLYLISLIFEMLASTYGQDQLLLDHMVLEHKDLDHTLRPKSQKKKKKKKKKSYTRKTYTLFKSGKVFDVTVSNLTSCFQRLRQAMLCFLQESNHVIKLR